MKLTRRTTLLGAVAFTGGARSEARSPGNSGKRPLGLADITVRKELASHYAGTLERVAAMGYTHFGFRLANPAQNSNEPSAAAKVRMIGDVGLKIGPARFNPIDSNFDRQIDQAAQIGVKIIVMTAATPFLASGRIGWTTREAFDAWLPQLAAIAAKCRAAGLEFAYHNHAWDMVKLDGESPLDIIARSVSPRDLSFEIDLAWTWYGGVAPLDLLRRLGSRVSSLHLKDVDRSRGTSPNELSVVVGQGEMHYEALLPRIYELTPAIGYVEVDAPRDGLMAAREAAMFLRKHSLR